MQRKETHLQEDTVINTNTLLCVNSKLLWLHFIICTCVASALHFLYFAAGENLQKYLPVFEYFLPNPGIEPGSLALQSDSLPSEPHQGSFIFK